MGGLLFLTGYLLTLGVGGSVWSLIGRTRQIKQHFDTLFYSLPMGREEVNDLSKHRH